MPINQGPRNKATTSLIDKTTALGVSLTVTKDDIKNSPAKPSRSSGRETGVITSSEKNPMSPVFKLNLSPLACSQIMLL